MKILLLSFLASMILLTACGDQEAGPQGRSETDSLFQDVMDAHNVGMAKMKKLTQFQQRTQAIIDSVNKLPAAGRKAASDYVQKLDSLYADLQYAESGMQTWMNEFKVDSANNDHDARLKYLSEEKNKVTQVKEIILATIARADSLLKQ